jgi:hypothetical protein
MMPDASDIAWFKATFGTRILQAVAGTPFDIDMLTAVACQETGPIWSRLRRQGLPVSRVLALCVGDTLDADAGRRAFPRTAADLRAWQPGGRQMFAQARQALVDMAAHIPGYERVARDPDKFCHAFGIFQYDLQFFKTNPDYFLRGGYADFPTCAALCVAELTEGLHRLGWQGRAQLSDLEMACVAIAYNTGRCDPSLGLQQGYRDADGKYYGELFYAFLLQARATPSAPPVPADRRYVVATTSQPLNLRQTPLADPGNILAELPPGTIVRALAAAARDGYLKVEAPVNGGMIAGYAAVEFLAPASGTADPPAKPPPLGQPGRID